MPHAPTPLAEVDAHLARLAAKKNEWVNVPIPTRISYLRKCLDGVVAVAEKWVEGGAALKGIAPGDTLTGEEWIAGPWQTARNVRLLIQALEQRGAPIPPSVKTRPDGQVVARVFPVTLQDRLMFQGYSGEVWIEPGKPATQGRIYREPAARGKVALVLGAGNVSSIPPMDALYKLFVDNEVVVLKVNPVNDHVGPRLEDAFRALIDDGYLAIVYGGADVGAHLSSHREVDTLHVTGSDKTYDAIVWGAGDELARRKAKNDPKNRRPFTAELGCVTPMIVVPGQWSDKDLAFQARQVAGMVAQNASFNCNAAKVLITAKGWPQRAAFLAKVDEVLARTPARKAYYPGADARYREFLDHYPAARAVGPKAEGAVPWTILPEVPAEKGEYALTHEAFCGVLAETSLDASDPATFLKKAVAFANESCWGTLSCGVFLHPDTERQCADELDHAIANLRYGGIGINCWPAMVYGLVSTTWGAYPGHTARDIQSGAGVVHNAYLFDYPQKSVVRAPFRMNPIPVWFPDHKNLAALGRHLLRMEAKPSWRQFAKVAVAGLRG